MFLFNCLSFGIEKKHFQFHKLQKMSSRRIGLCLLFGDNGKWKIHQLAYENTMFVLSFPT